MDGLAESGRPAPDVASIPPGAARGSSAVAKRYHSALRTSMAWRWRGLGGHAVARGQAEKRLHNDVAREDLRSTRETEGEV